MPTNDKNIYFNFKKCNTQFNLLFLPSFKKKRKKSWKKSFKKIFKIFLNKNFKKKNYLSKFT